MSTLMNSIYEKAKALNKHIVLAEGEEQRVIDGAIIARNKGIARVTLIGNEQIIKSKAKESLDGINIVDPNTSELTAKYANLFYELRKAKGVTPEDAAKKALDPIHFGILMVKSGDADGLVAGAVHSTGDTLRPALQIIKTKPGIKSVSSIFVMCLPEGSKYGCNGVMVYGDCAVNINPDADQLSDIAIASAESAKAIAGITEPKVAMLSFSTKGSAKHEFVDKVALATKLAKEKAPDLCIDGELQVDAALVKSVQELKAPGSDIAAQANVLIFPDIQAGNIAYKLTQRLGNAEALGPICQGFAKPVNDLSRGCNAEDVAGVVAITSLQV